jgi:hypothetical protein
MLSLCPKTKEHTKSVRKFPVVGHDFAPKTIFRIALILKTIPFAPLLRQSLTGETPKTALPRLCVRLVNTSIRQCLIFEQ